MSDLRRRSPWVLASLVGVVGLLGWAWLWFSSPAPPRMLVPIRLGEVTVWVEIAKKPEEQIRGLMGRPLLPENQGMLFVFETLGLQGFWMQNVKFPLDLLWFDENGRLVHAVKQAPPCVVACPVYEPPVAAMYVLEVNGGFLDRHQIPPAAQLVIPPELRGR